MIAMGTERRRRAAQYAGDLRGDSRRSETNFSLLAWEARTAQQL